MELESYEEIFEEGSRLTLEPKEGTNDLERGFAMMMYLAQNRVLEAHMVLSSLFTHGKGCIQSQAFSRYWLRRYFFLYDEANSTNESEKFDEGNLERIENDQDLFKDFLKNLRLENLKDYQNLVDLMMWAKLAPGQIVKDDIGFSYGSANLTEDKECYGMLGMNIVNCLSQGMGIYYHTDFTKDAFYHAFRYGDLSMLELTGDMNAYYPYDINWSQEGLGTSLKMDKEFLESLQPMIYQDEYQPLFPFESRQMLKKRLIDLGIDTPRFGLVNTKFGYFMTFNLMEKASESENPEKFVNGVGQIIKWHLPRAYPIMSFPADKLATEEL